MMYPNTPLPCELNRQFITALTQRLTHFSQSMATQSRRLEIINRIIQLANNKLATHSSLADFLKAADDALTQLSEPVSQFTVLGVNFSYNRYQQEENNLINKIKRLLAAVQREQQQLKSHSTAAKTIVRSQSLPCLQHPHNEPQQEAENALQSNSQPAENSLANSTRIQEKVARTLQQQTHTHMLNNPHYNYFRQNIMNTLPDVVSQREEKQQAEKQRLKKQQATNSLINPTKKSLHHAETAQEKQAIAMGNHAGYVQFNQQVKTQIDKIRLRGGHGAILNPVIAGAGVADDFPPPRNRRIHLN